MSECGSKAGEIVIMLPFRYKFDFKAVLLCIEGQRVKVDVEPVERLSQHIPLLHLIVQKAIIVISQVNHEAAVLLLEKIAEVA